MSLNNLGLAWYELGKYQEALTLFEQAESIVTEKLGKNLSYARDIRENIQEVKKRM